MSYYERHNRKVAKLTLTVSILVAIEAELTSYKTPFQHWYSTKLICDALCGVRGRELECICEPSKVHVLLTARYDCKVSGFSHDLVKLYTVSMFFRKKILEQCIE